MGFLSFVFIMTMLLATTWIWVYPVFRAVSRGKPNPMTGYRTARTMSSQRNWKIGNQLGGKYLFRVSVPLSVLTLGAFAWLFFNGNRVANDWSNLSLVVCALWLAATIAVYLVVERQLKALPPEDETQALAQPLG